jgi:hypothetical protein
MTSGTSDAVKPTNESLNLGLSDQGLNDSKLGVIRSSRELGLRDFAMVWKALARGSAGNSSVNGRYVLKDLMRRYDSAQAGESVHAIAMFARLRYCIRRTRCCQAGAAEPPFTA